MCQFDKIETAPNKSFMSDQNLKYGLRSGDGSKLFENVFHIQIQTWPPGSWIVAYLFVFTTKLKHLFMCKLKLKLKLNISIHVKPSTNINKPLKA